MGKRGRVLIAIAAVAILAVLAWGVLRSSATAPEPVYKGKPLSYWLQGYGFTYNATNRPNYQDAQIAMMAAGTNAIPVLLRMLRAQDSPLKTRLLWWSYRYAYFRDHFRSAGALNSEALNGFANVHDASGAVPELIKMVNENRHGLQTTYAIIILSQIGPAAHEAVPSLLHTLAGTNESARAAALEALGGIHANPQAVVPVLIKALHDSSAGTRARAVVALGGFRGDASPAVPDLLAILHEPDGGSNSVPPTPSTMSVRAAADYALRQIDPETYARVITNNTQAPIPSR
jgi:HEAT repeat protein